MSVVNDVITWCNSIADDPNYEYSQDGDKRWGTHSRSTPPYYYDCSSFVSDAFRRYNDVHFDFTNGFTVWTGNMREVFLTNGYFKDVTTSGIIKYGDVLLTHTDVRQHTCIYTGSTDVQNIEGVNKLCVEAIGTAYGIRKNYNDTHQYQYILRYVGRPPTWHGKTEGGYNKESEQAIDNARMIYAYMSEQGFSLEAVAGMLGSIEVESGYNPFRWETRNPPEPTVLSKNDLVLMGTTRHGYGLVQFTPSLAYAQIGGYPIMNFSDQAGDLVADANLQLDVIARDRLSKWSQNPVRNIPAEFNMSMAQFKECTDLYRCSGAWLYCYEFPGQVASQVQTRYGYAQYWYEVLSGYEPIPPTPPMPTIKRNKWQVWLYKRNTERKRRL